MRRGGTFIFLLLGLGLLGVALWAASYARVTVGRFPWPGGTGQTRDRAFLILVDGRLALVRQSLQIVLSEQGVLVREDFDREPKEGQGSFVAADARTLGTFIARQSIEEGTTRITEDATLTLTSVKPALGQFTWQKLGLEAGVLAQPRMQVEAAVVTGRVWAAVVPLWPVAVLVIPGLVLLTRERRRRRMKVEGRCLGCGYDLRGSPGRCPECGGDPIGAPGFEPINRTEPM